MNYYEQSQELAEAVAKASTGSPFIGGRSGISLAACIADFGLLNANPGDLAAAWIECDAQGDYAPMEELAYGSGGQS